MMPAVADKIQKAEDLAEGADPAVQDTLRGLVEIVRDLQAEADYLRRESNQDFLQSIETVASVVERAVQAEAVENGDEDRLLDAEEAADILGVKKRYVYDNADDWPFTRRLSRRKLRFSERGLYRWLETRP